ATAAYRRAARNRKNRPEKQPACCAPTCRAEVEAQNRKRKLTQWGDEQGMARARLNAPPVAPAIGIITSKYSIQTKPLPESAPSMHYDLPDLRLVAAI